MMAEVHSRKGFLEEKVYGAWRRVSLPRTSLQGSLLVPSAICYVTDPSFSPEGQVSFLPLILPPRKWIQGGGVTLPRSHSWG